MAAPLDISSATTFEGQLTMLLEHATTLQSDTTPETGTNRDNLSVITKTLNEVSGVQTTNLSMNIITMLSANGYTNEPEELFYPKVSGPTTGD